METTDKEMIQKIQDSIDLWYINGCHLCQIPYIDKKNKDLLESCINTLKIMIEN